MFFGPVLSLLLTATQAVWGKILYAGVNEVGLYQLRVLLSSQSNPKLSLAVNLVCSHRRIRLDLDFPGDLASTMRLSTRSRPRSLGSQIYVTLTFTKQQTTVDIFIDQEKINFFRVTFLMERMCPLSFGLGSRFNETVRLFVIFL